MIVRSAYAYVGFFFALELLLLTASLLLHLSIFIGVKEPYEGFGVALFRIAVVVGFPVASCTSACRCRPYIRKQQSYFP